MSFRKARLNLNLKKRAKLDELLAKWDAGDEISKHAADNLQSEKGAKTVALTSYLKKIAFKNGKLLITSPGLSKAFCEIGSDFSLQGYPAAPFQRALFGRAILLEKYAERYLQKTLSNMDYFEDLDQIQDNLRSLSGLSASSVPRSLRHYIEAISTTNLGYGPTFATSAFKKTDSIAPWYPPIPSASAVRHSIALGEDPPDKEYLLFIYRLPPTVVPRVPTTASPGWAYQRWFRPNPRAARELHGWTKPLTSAYNARREFVHTEIDASTLLWPIYTAAP